MSDELMEWRHFSRWAHERFGIPVPRRTAMGPAYRAAWAMPDTKLNDGHPGVGQGHHAQYGPRERRRVACYARMKDLVGGHATRGELRKWVVLAGEHDTGYLMNDGTGVHWVPDLEPIRASIAAGLAVGAVRCGE